MISEFDHPEPHTHKWTKMEVEWIEQKIAAAIAAEREACAKVCSQLSHIGSENQLWMRDRCVSAIRARGETK